jgi:hypothetical protein
MEKRSIGWNNISIGKKTKTDKILKISWTIAAGKAFENSFSTEKCPKEATRHVIVVPILAPIIIGTALDTVNVPAATNPTVIEVVTELDCIIAVASIPMNRPVKGFEVELINTLAKPVPKPLREQLKISIPKRNR